MPSKIIPHVIQMTSAAQSWVSNAPSWKGLDQQAPIVRKFWPDDEMNRRIANMAVDETVADLLPLIGPNTAWIDGPFNEVAQRQGLGLEQHADFMAAFVPAMKAAKPGILVSGFAFSTGNPGSSAFGDKDDFQYLYNRGWCGCDAISLHCYFGTDGFDLAYALRYRALCSTVPSHPPIIISECGVDAVPGGAKGWMAAGLSADEYVNLLASYDAELLKDPYVLFAAVFTAGPTPDWNAYSTDPLDMSRFYINSGVPAMDEATQTALIQLEAKQNQLLTDMIKAIRTGQWTGPGSVDGIYCALKGGIAAPDYTPSFP